MISDVGSAQAVGGRARSRHEPNTVLISNGFAAMGFALPAAIAAKLARPTARWWRSPATAAC